MLVPLEWLHEYADPGLPVDEVERRLCAGWNRIDGLSWAEARRLVESFGVQGFKFHPTMQGFEPNDRSAYVLYEAIAANGYTFTEAGRRFG